MMLDNLLALFALPVFSRALIALLAGGLAFPAIGTFILNLELLPARFAIMHAGLMGAAIGMAFGASPALVGMAACLLAGVCIALLSWKNDGGSGVKTSAGGALGLVMTLCLGLTFIIFYKSNVQAAAAFNIFGGNILSLSREDMFSAIIIAALVLICIIVFYKEIQVVLYDCDIARASGLHAFPVYFGIILLVCLSVAASMRVVGAFMVDALTIIPALAARKIGRTFKAVLIAGAIAGLVMNISGFLAAFIFDLPTSPAIILCGVIMLGLISVFSLRHKF
ncbi:MAG: metal ABC transporter permease [Spirochaetaceae bacterium]|jgi:zinc transport system permease protein|nr:metal ABC transporter permease [Spirochaetaceae bacterium]